MAGVRHTIAPRCDRLAHRRRNKVLNNGIQLVGGPIYRGLKGKPVEIRRGPATVTGEALPSAHRSATGPDRTGKARKVGAPEARRPAAGLN